MRLALLSALLGILLVPSVAVGKGASDSSLPQGRVRLQFREHLGILQELQLTGTTDTRSASFTLPSRWKALPGGSLHLFVRHSADLDGSRSFLSVSLNYGILRSFRLDPQNATVTEVVVPIPPEMFKQKNALVFTVEQFPRAGASGAEIWSSINGRSFLEIRYEEEPPELNLGRLTSSLLEPHTFSNNRLAVLLPRRFEQATLEATALLVANLCKRSAPDRVAVDVVRSISVARDPLLVVGTPAEQPELASLRERSPLAFAKLKGRMVLQARNGTILDSEEGLVALATSTRADRNPILLVTGNSAAGVLRAARSVLSPTWSASGNLARVTTDVRWTSPKVREWHGFIPPRSSFTLADLGLEDLKITSERDSTLELPLNATPDARFFDFGHRMALKFRLNPDLYVGDARLLVQVNDVTVADYVVKEEFRRSTGSVPATIPLDVLKPRNVLRIIWKGPTQGATHGVLAWLLSASEFYLPRSYETELPELGLLQSQLFPFSLKGDLSDVIVVPTSDLNEETFSALLELSVAFARLAPARHLAFRVRRPSELTQTDRSQSHLVFLNLEERRDPLTALLPNWKPRPPVESLRGRPTIREMTSPWSPQRYVLVISAQSGRLLQHAVRDVFSEPTLGRLRGDVAYLAAGHPDSFVSGPKRRVRESAYLTFVEAWLRTHWLALPIILIAVSGLLFVGVRLALRHYRSRD